MKAKQKETVSTSGNIMGRGTRIFLYVTLTIAALAVILPLLWLLLASLKTRQDLTRNTWGLPQTWEFKNYYLAWTGSRIPRYMINSIRATFLSIVLTVVLSTPVSFVVSRFRFKGNNLLYLFFIAGMMIPIHSTVIPIYTMVGDLNMKNNLEVLSLIYGAYRIPVSIFILEGFMSGIPRELEECAVIDGATVWDIFFRVIAPLSRDGIVTIAILTVLSSWNELLISMLLISNSLLKTLPTGLMGFITDYNSEYTQLAAGIMIAIIPPIIFYMFAQEKIEKGMIAGAVKG
ncbi:MAG: carbohydrate ABC transporter permease [Lachnospiraceae bacterium]|nr:carbohydrate ABC transporter permease [Lachnospiraceae bacterium]